MRVELDGRQISTALDFHRVLAEALDFGPYYGHNLDALWDRLSTDVERPVHLVLHHAWTAKRRWGAGPFRVIVSILDEVQRSDETLGLQDRFTFELAPEPTWAFWRRVRRRPGR